MSSFSLSGNIIDIVSKEIFSGTVTIEDGIILSIEQDDKHYSNFIMPGFIDAHIHIESSMLTPSEFARKAVKFGTVATVSDPHEIANVLGMNGVKFMIDDSNKVPFKFYFGAPSCVPATGFETSGAELSVNDIEILFDEYGIKYLSEMMNYPGVVFDDKDVHAKLDAAKKRGLPIDGHAPDLSEKDLVKYIKSGISTDHESITLSGAIDKIFNGMKILIREGSAAKNFDELYKLIEARPEMTMLCSDDLHSDDLIKGHINLLIKRALKKGLGLMNVLRAAILNPIDHYKLDIGYLQEGDPADMIVVNNLNDFEVLKTYISGQLVYDEGHVLIEPQESQTINKFDTSIKSAQDFALPSESDKIKVMCIEDGSLMTNAIYAKAKIVENMVESDQENDILKIAVVNRYADSKPAIGFAKGFGIKDGAIASSVAHDSHNIVVVGTSDEYINEAVNLIIEQKGGLASISGVKRTILPLPIAGLMSDKDADFTAQKYSELNEVAKEMGSSLKAPFMTLSFMALLVIPELKLSDKGLFSSKHFDFTSVFVK